MERLTRPDVDVTEYADKFLNTRLKGKEIDWKRTNDAGIDLLINAITCDEFSKDVFRQMARDLYGRLKQFEDAFGTPEKAERVKLAFMGKAVYEIKEFNNVPLARLIELAEADKDGRVAVLPFTSGRTLLCDENIDGLRLMKDVGLAIRYCSSIGIVFYMGYDVFCDLVKHGRITAVSEEAERAMEGNR